MANMGCAQAKSNSKMIESSRAGNKKLTAVGHLNSATGPYNRSVSATMASKLGSERTVPGTKIVAWCAPPSPPPGVKVEVDAEEDEGRRWRAFGDFLISLLTCSGDPIALALRKDVADLLLVGVWGSGPALLVLKLLLRDGARVCGEYVCSHATVLRVVTACA